QPLSAAGDDAVQMPAEDVDQQADDTGDDEVDNFDADLNTSSGFKLQFPLLSKDAPKMVFGLFQGKPINLFQFDLTALKLDFNYRQEFPILPPLNATLHDSFEAEIHPVFDDDIHGLHEAVRDRH